MLSTNTSVKVVKLQSNALGITAEHTGQDFMTPPRLPAWPPGQPIKNSAEAMRVHPGATQLADMGHSCNLPLLNRERCYFQADYRKPDYHLDPSFSVRYQKACEDRFAKLYRSLKTRKNQQQQQQQQQQGQQKNSKREKKDLTCGTLQVESTPVTQLSSVDKTKRVHFHKVDSNYKTKSSTGLEAKLQRPKQDDQAIGVTFLDIAKMPAVFRKPNKGHHRARNGTLAAQSKLNFASPHTDRIRKMLRSSVPVGSSETEVAQETDAPQEARESLVLSTRRTSRTKSPVLSALYCDSETQDRIEEWLRAVQDDQSRDGKFTPTVVDHCFEEDSSGH